MHELAQLFVAGLTGFAIGGLVYRHEAYREWRKNQLMREKITKIIEDELYAIHTEESAKASRHIVLKLKELIK